PGRRRDPAELHRLGDHLAPARRAPLRGGAALRLGPAAPGAGAVDPLPGHLRADERRDRAPGGAEPVVAPEQPPVRLVVRVALSAGGRGAHLAVLAGAVALLAAASARASDDAGADGPPAGA